MAIVIQQDLMYDNLIEFNAEVHKYNLRKDGSEFRSVTRGLKSIKEPFDAKGISFAMAKRELGNMDFKLIQKRAEEIREEWRLKADNAASYGTDVHKVCEDYLKTGIYDPGYEKLIQGINSIIHGAYHVFSERIFYSEKHKMAGTGDLSIIRQKMKYPVMDFYDFKTNIEKGIVFDSAKRINGELVKHYNRFLLHPVDYLEDCNYNLYALQLSIYAYMAQITYNVRVGRTGILFINKEFSLEVIPVPYMRMEAEMVLDHVSGLKSINEVAVDNFYN